MTHWNPRLLNFGYLKVGAFLSYLMKVESAAGLDGLGEELAVDAVLVSSTSIIVHADDDDEHHQHHQHQPPLRNICDSPRRGMRGWGRGEGRVDNDATTTGR